MKKIKRANITWDCIKVLVVKIKPTPNNYKLFDEEGAAVFRNSLDTFGKAGSVILNKDFTLVDGNSRWKDAIDNKEKYLWASMPSRQLTLKEFKTMSAIFDRARAGTVDTQRIGEELGDTKSFFKQWGIPMPNEVVTKLQELDSAAITPDKKKLKEVEESNVMPVSLIFNAEQNKKFMDKAKSLYSQFKVDNITDLVYKVILSTKKI